MADRISLRAPLHEAVARFLAGEAMTCEATTEGLAELVVALAHYREEGVPLFPQVLVCEHLDRLLPLLQGQDPVLVGHGPRHGALIAEALKRCAPLAQGGWAVFIERTETEFRYGVFRLSAQPLALTPAEGLLTEREGALSAVLIVQVAESVIELRGSSGQALEIHLNAGHPETEVSPRDAILTLAAAVTQNLGDDIREPALRYMRNALNRILQRSHGALVAVVGSLAEAGPIIANRVALTPPLDLPRRLKDFIDTPGVEELSALNGTATLLAGMLASDGVTVLGRDAKILAYRAFLPLPEGGRPLPGGARRWTFDTLCGDGAVGIHAAFYQSQDGRRACKRRETDA